MSNNQLLRDIFKIPLSSDVIECYRILGYNFIHMYDLHIKYDKLRSQHHNAAYYDEKQHLKLLQLQLPIVNYNIIRVVFYNILKKNI